MRFLCRLGIHSWYPRLGQRRFPNGKLGEYTYAIWCRRCSASLGEVTPDNLWRLSPWWARLLWRRK